MGNIIIQEETTKNPLELIGREAGICWGANTSDIEKNIKRGKECLSNQHGRTLEFPQVYFIADGYSARMIREFYTHIGGAPTRLQASTRYIDYGDFNYILPFSIEDDTSAIQTYNECMEFISNSIKRLIDLGVSKEDAANLLPLGMTTKIVCRTNLRNLIDMSHQRMCSRAYWEFRDFFNDLCNALCEYSDEWEDIVNNYFEPKCEFLGFCPEKYTCGRVPPKEI